jgi:Ca2+ transporting ATPase
LDKIATDIGKLGMYCAILIIHALLTRNFIESLIRREFDFFGGELTESGEMCTQDDHDNNLCQGFAKGYIKEWLSYLIIGVAIVVVAVPEGLPLAVMISLSYSVSKMLLDNNYVKKLSSCEIMGGANNICSDKTGTLTKNKMTWCKIWAGRDHTILNPDSKEQLDYEEFLGSKLSKDLLA